MELVTWFWEGLRAHVQKYPGFVILFICFSILAILSEIFLAILSIFALFLFHYYHHQPHFYFMVLFLYLYCVWPVIFIFSIACKENGYFRLFYL